MKNLKSSLRKAALAFNLILVLIGSDAFGQTLQDSCCNEIAIFHQRDSFNLDTCTGSLLINFPNDTICGMYRAVSNEGDTAIWSSSKGAYEIKYGIPLGGSKHFTIYFKGYWGDTICQKYYSIFCPNCCDSNIVWSAADSNIEDNCQGFVYFTFDSSCLYHQFKTQAQFSNSLIWDQGLKSWKTPYSLAKGQSFLFKGYYLSLTGDTVCTKELNVYCPIDSCCDLVQIHDSPYPRNSPEEPCCGIVTVNNTDYCDIGQIRITDFSSYPGFINQLSSNTFEYCIPVGEVLNWQIEIFDPNGYEICRKQFDKICSPEMMGKGKTSEANNGTKSIEELSLTPNPVTDVLTITLPYKGPIALNIYDISGKLVLIKQVNFIDRDQVMLSELQQGLYIIEVIASEKIHTKKLVISK
jgi:hypothetical protein